MNDLNKFDKTDREYSITPTDDLVRFWRSKVKVQVHSWPKYMHGGEGIYCISPRGRRNLSSSVFSCRSVGIDCASAGEDVSMSVAVVVSRQCVECLPNCIVISCGRRYVISQPIQTSSIRCGNYTEHSNLILSITLSSRRTSSQPFYSQGILQCRRSLTKT